MKVLVVCDGGQFVRLGIAGSRCGRPQARGVPPTRECCVRNVVTGGANLQFLLMGIVLRSWNGLRIGLGACESRSVWRWISSCCV